MTDINLFRAVSCLVCGVLSPALLTQCKTTAASYKDVSYDSTKLKTPAGHGLEKKDYPFDENGAYRKDWVKSNASGRDSSAVKSAESSTQLASTSTTDSGTSSTGSNAYPTYAEASAARGSGNFVGPAGGASPPSSEAAGGIVTTSAPVSSAPAAAPVSATRYHKVSSGDTLFSLSGRYGVSVAELKRLNGLKTDTIRVGQSLRIP